MVELELRLVFKTSPLPHLLDISSILYDIELLHDFVLLLSGGMNEGRTPTYENYRFQRTFWYRNGRPLREEDKVRAGWISKTSPLTVELVFAAITVSSGAFWLLLQAIEKIQNWKINRERLKLEVENLKVKTAMEELELEELLRKKEKEDAKTCARYVLESLTRKLGKNPLYLEDIEIVMLPSDELRFVDEQESSSERHGKNEP